MTRQFTALTPAETALLTWANFEHLVRDYGPTVAIIAILLGMLWFVRKNWPLISGAVKIVDLLVSLDTKLEQVGETLKDHGGRLERVEHELKPNSGKSLRDSLDRTETLVHEIAERGEAVERRQLAIEQQLGAHLLAAKNETPRRAATRGSTKRS